MQRATFLLLLAPVIAPANHVEGPETAARTVAVYAQFTHPPAGISIEQMKVELAAIMAPLSLHFDWRSLENANGRDPATELLVVNFKGECQADWLMPLTSHRGALGWTHVSDGEILPFVGVDCDRIRDLMSRSLSIAPTPERPRMLGRAMARVLAHEMYHFLLKTTRHATAGIAKSSYTAAELAGQFMRFDGPQLLAVQQDKRPPQSAKGQSSAALDAE